MARNRRGSSGDVTPLRAVLQRSLEQGQDAIRVIDRQETVSPALQRIRAQLICWETIAQEELNLLARVAPWET
jgi:hypothetical protein